MTTTICFSSFLAIAFKVLLDYYSYFKFLYNKNEKEHNSFAFSSKNNILVFKFK